VAGVAIFMETFSSSYWGDVINGFITWGVQGLGVLLWGGENVLIS